jgi:general secretion pathway protein G
MSTQIRSRVAPEQDGFTLIELLIVIVILGVLAGIVVFAVGGINDSSKTSACKSDLKTGETAIEAYYAKSTPTHAYPADLGSLVNAKLLKDALPEATTSDYYFTYTQATGVIVANHAGATGCP